LHQGQNVKEASGWQKWWKQLWKTESQFVQHEDIWQLDEYCK
jgi:hypothetical protein